MTQISASNSDPKKRRRQDRWFIIAMMAPYLALLGFFGIAPVVYAIGLSFMDTIDWVFWGFTNYEFVLNDFRLIEAIQNVFTYVAIWLTMMVVGIAGLSLMLDALPDRAASVLRTSFFLPGAITSSAIVILWLFLLDPAVSPYGALFEALGWENRRQVVSHFGYPVVFALMAYLAYSGGWIVVIGGALKGISKEVVEAAHVDGANQFQIATRVKLPMVWRSLALMAILSFANGIQMFVEPQLMSLAGSTYSRPDWSVNQLAFQYAFNLGDFGASAAMSTMLLGVAIFISLCVVFGTRFYKMD
ncbi:sugar ABC transporter permease [Shimia sp. R9_3]|uniref:carbohydrate ABC transporter permease n=1 Tax=Shimia sp. R9_3 TaxID=2821113 RepID=UPI001ADBF05D|nr:sugar ABC transporter permease [Shimia sp. R9_3]MBO9402930.1 sugar ABC transporter permease [Shimia sp. R9_3]